jgi:phage-related protein
VDFSNRTVTRNDGANMYSDINFLTTTWFELQPGANNIRFMATGTTGASSMLMTWQDAWI